MLAALARSNDPRAETLIKETSILAATGNVASGATIVAMLHDLASEGGKVSVMGADAKKAPAKKPQSLVEKIKGMAQSAEDSVESGIKAVVKKAGEIVTSSESAVVSAAASMSKKVEGLGDALSDALVKAGDKAPAKKAPASKASATVDENARSASSHPIMAAVASNTAPVVITLPQSPPWYTMNYWRK